MKQLRCTSSRGSPAASAGPWPTGLLAAHSQGGLIEPGLSQARVPCETGQQDGEWPGKWGISAPLAHLLSYFSMLSQGVLPGTTNPAAPHEKTFYWPRRCLSSRMPSISHTGIDQYLRPLSF